MAMKQCHLDSISVRLINTLRHAFAPIHPCSLTYPFYLEFWLKLTNVNQKPGSWPFSAPANYHPISNLSLSGNSKIASSTNKSHTTWSHTTYFTDAVWFPQKSFNWNSCRPDLQWHRTGVRSWFHHCLTSFRLQCSCQLRRPCHSSTEPPTLI